MHGFTYGLLLLVIAQLSTALFLGFFSPITIRRGFVLSLSLAAGILSIVFFSSIADISVSDASLILLLVVLLSLLVRIKYIWQIVLGNDGLVHRTLFLIGIYSYLNLFPLFMESNLVSRNFDALYALQDASYMVTHPYNTSNSNSDALFPINWSADLGDRYGISLFIPLGTKLGFGNPAQLGTYVYLAIMSIFLLILKDMVNNLLEDSRFRRPAIVLVALSPSILIQISYMMFGQILGLVLLAGYVSLLEFKEKSRQKVDTLKLLILLGLLVAYPALFLFVLFVDFIHRLMSEQKWYLINKLSTNLFLSLGQFLSVVIIVYFISGFKLSFLEQRFIAWISNQIPLAEQPKLLSIDLDLFSQFHSFYGPSLALGILPYPFQDYSLSVVIRFLLTLIGVMSVIFLLFALSKSRPSRVDLGAIILATLLFQVLGMLTSNGYLIFKTAVWSGPFLLLYFIWIFSTKFDTLMGRQLGGESKRKLILISVFVLFFLTLSTFTSFQYFSRIERWDSFWNAPTRSEIRKLNHLFDNHQYDRRILLSYPSAEEAIWSAINIDVPRSTAITNFGPLDQALTVSGIRDCESNFYPASFSEETVVVNDKSVQDIVPPMVFRNRAINSSGPFESFKLDDLNLGFFIASGAYPPEKLGNLDLQKVIGGSVARWMTGTLCVGIYSAQPRNVELSFNYLPGPDSNGGELWHVADDSGIVREITSKKGHVSIVVKVFAGTSFISISKPGCQSEKSRKSIFGNPDDRLLCALIGPINNSQ